MDIFKYLLVSVCVIASVICSAAIFSANGPTGLPGEVNDRLLDRADQVKKGDVDARRITEELGKPNPDNLEEQLLDNVDNANTKNMDEREHDIDPALKTNPDGL